MTALDLPVISSPTFSAASSLNGNTIRMRFTGNADLGARDALELLLPRVHSEAQRLVASEVVVDFKDLEFMNSSCFRSFVSWVSDLQDLPPDKQYRIRMLSNASMLWQRRSLHALKCFANELVHVDT
jgi:hypothetical protein